METKTHSLLSPSSSERWINCSGSILLPQYNEERDTTAADEGSLIHKIAEYKLLKDEWNDFKEELDECRKSELYAPEMEHYSEEYVSFVLNKEYDTLLVEELIDLDFIYPNFFGTADCILMSEENGLQVIDLKYGRFKVPAKKNSQLLIYALGAARLFNKKYPHLKNFPIILTIYQPRIKNFDSWSLDWEALCKWNSETLIPALGKINFEVIELNAGSYCRFCPSNIFCREYNNQILFDEESDIKALSNSEIEEILKKLEGVDKYVKRLKSYISDEIKSGNRFDDYKLVAGRNSYYWEDEAKLINELKTDGNYEKVIQLSSPAQLKKKLGKESKKYSQFIGTKTGRPMLVHRSDKKEELKFEN